MEVLLAPQAASIGSPELHDLFSPLHAPVTEAPSVAVEQAPVEPHPTVEQTAEAAQAPAPSPSGCPAVIIEVFGPAAPAACAVAYCESGWNPDATGAEGEMSYFQVHPRWHPDATYDPRGNAQAAYRISNGGYDWSAWTCGWAAYQ